MATMTLTSDSGALVASSTGGTGFNIQIQDTVTAIGMKYVTDSTSTTATLTVKAGTCYIFEQPLTSLTITEVIGSRYESAIIFTAGTGILVGIPETVEVVGLAPVFVSNTKYIMSFRDNMLVVGEFNN